MSKLEDYTARAALSLTAAEAATTERDRAFHHRAHSIWRKMIAGIPADEQRELDAIGAGRAKGASPARPRGA